MFRWKSLLDAPLYGASGKLESLDFVTLIMEVEEKINAEFGTDITIADENLFVEREEPLFDSGNADRVLAGPSERKRWHKGGTGVPPVNTRKMRVPPGTYSTRRATHNPETPNGIFI